MVDRVNTLINVRPGWQSAGHEPSPTGLAEQVDAMLAAATDACDLGEGALRTQLVECEKAQSMLQAAQADVMVQMRDLARAADQAEAAHRGQLLWSRQCRQEFVADEIAVLLGCTKAAADYAATPTGLHGGGRTAPQLREWLRRRVITTDPQAAEARRQRALTDRRVIITPGDDGMSELWALLPFVQARRIQGPITAHQVRELTTGNGANDPHITWRRLLTDHTIPWPNGPTSAANLAILCRRHHRLKHTPGWTVHLHPTGHTITTHPWHCTNPHPPDDEGPGEPSAT